MKFIKFMFLVGVLALVTAWGVPTTVLAEYVKGDGNLGSKGSSMEDDRKNGNYRHKTGVCNTTYFNYKHNGFSPTNVYVSTHIRRDGRICIITHMSYVHSKTCISCKGNMGFDAFYCTNQHSICSDPVSTCKQR